MREMPGSPDPASERAMEERLGQVRDGMTVLDRAGRVVGKVSFVKLGDPDAASDEGEAMAEAPGEVVAAPGSVMGLSGGNPIVSMPVGPSDDEGIPDVAEPLRARLLRSGYLKVAHAHLFGKSHYVQADQIATVDGDTVRLNVDLDHLPTNG